LEARRCGDQRLARHSELGGCREYGSGRLDGLTVICSMGWWTIRPAVQMMQAISTTGTPPMARVAWLEPGIIMKLLDAGAMGIVCPMINTREECERFVGACRYPPFPGGYRSFGPVRATWYFGSDYFRTVTRPSSRWR